MTRAVWLALLVVAGLAICPPLARAQELTPSLERARAFYDAGNLDAARRDLEALVRAGTQDPQVFLLLGVVERTAGHFDSAIASLQQAHALARSATPMAVELATTLAWNRDLDRAIALFREVLTTDPAAAGARIGLAFALAWQGHLDEAHTMFAAMTEDDPRNVSAWIGVGFVARASLRTADSAAAYRHVLELEPGNVEATTALETLRWDRRGETRVLAGFSANPGVDQRGEGRIDATYGVDPRLTVLGAYQHYAFGAVSPVIGGGLLFGTRAEDSLEGGVIFRPSSRTALAASLYTFWDGDVTRGIVWAEGVLAITSHVSLIGNFRPAFSTADPHWLWAGAAGAAVSLPYRQQLTARVLIAADTEFEPKLTLLASYDAAMSSRLKLRIGAAHSSTDEQFEFTSVSGGATYLLTPALGLSADATHRTGTAERSSLLVGIVVRH